VRGVTSGTFETFVEKYEAKPYDAPALEELKQRLIAARRRLGAAVAFAKQQGPAYVDLSGRRLVDAAIAVIVGHFRVGQAAVNDRKKKVARRFIDRELPILGANCEQVLSGDSAALSDYDLLAGPVPSTA